MTSLHGVVLLNHLVSGNLWRRVALPLCREVNRVPRRCVRIDGEALLRKRILGETFAPFPSVEAMKSGSAAAARAKTHTRKKASADGEGHGSLDFRKTHAAKKHGKASRVAAKYAAKREEKDDHGVAVAAARNCARISLPSSMPASMSCAKKTQALRVSRRAAAKKCHGFQSKNKRRKAHSGEM